MHQLIINNKSKGDLYQSMHVVKKLLYKESNQPSCPRLGESQKLLKQQKRPMLQKNVQMEFKQLPKIKDNDLIKI